MAHNVICVYCKKQFDRDKESFVETSPRRYGHKICVDKVNSSKTQNEIDYEDLELYIKKLFKKICFHTLTKRKQSTILCL